jgi:myo-inositol-1(or 4)-monophosphatase
MASTRELLDFAIDVATQAGQQALGYYRSGVTVEWKPDQSPVTAADRACEELLRRSIEHHFPDHAIVGEELGETDRDSRHRWFIDPIDGTQSFIRGVPLWGVLLGLEIDADMVVGVVNLPALGEIVTAATGLGCSRNGRPTRVSAVGRLDQALVAFTDPRALASRRPDAWARLQARTRLQRGWGDCYAHCLVATGRAEVALDPIVSAWDCAPLLPILREAGGTFTDWDGRVTIDGGSAISTNGGLFEEVMRVINGQGISTE